MINQNHEKDENHENENHEKSIAMVIGELKVEVRDFVQTRLEILKQELQTKLAMIKLAAPLLVVALALLGVGFLCISGLFVVLIAQAWRGGMGMGVSDRGRNLFHHRRRMRHVRLRRGEAARPGAETYHPGAEAGPDLAAQGSAFADVTA